MNKLVKTVTKDTLIYEFLKSLNGILDITDRELKIERLSSKNWV